MIRGKIKKMMAAALAATMVFTMTACGNDSEEKTADGYAKEIYLYNWSEYMSEDVLNKFEEEYGIKVVETTFESNDEMLAKLMAGGGSEYDIAVPSNFYIESMKANDLLEPLDKDVITNYDTYRTMQCDPDGEYCVPYMGTSCVWIANKKMLDDYGIEIHKMDDLKNDNLKNNILLVDDSQAIMSVGLLGCDLDPTSGNLDDIAKAKDYISGLNPYIKAFAASTDTRDSMAKGEVAVALMYSGEALQAMKENPDLEVVMDGEQCSLSMDTMVLLKGSKHKEEAELFLNFILRPDISAELTNEFQFICANKAAAQEYSDSELCGFTFTDDGYLALFELMKRAYDVKHWHCTRPKMPVLFVSGSDDPCMINVRHFAKAVQDMRRAGYVDVKGKLYPGMRHEILNETDRKRVYHDIAFYIKKKGF